MAARQEVVADDFDAGFASGDNAVWPPPGGQVAGADREIGGVSVHQRLTFVDERDAVFAGYQSECLEVPFAGPFGRH